MFQESLKDVSKKFKQSASARLSGRFSLAAEPGGDNSTQEITVEKQRAVHFSSNLLWGKLKPGGVPCSSPVGNRVSRAHWNSQDYLGVSALWALWARGCALQHGYPRQRVSMVARGLPGSFFVGRAGFLSELFLAHPPTHQFPETRSDQPPTHLKTSPWGTVDRGKDTLAIRVTGDTPTSSWMLSREQELASDADAGDQPNCSPTAVWR